jgi:hypothetical protein
MKPRFYRLNEGWNADPNAPYPTVEVVGEDIVLRFRVNPFQYPEFHRGELGVLRFVECERYRLGSPNDEAWYMGQCRFSKLAPAWGEFYLVQGVDESLSTPDDWNVVGSNSGAKKHFLFYFRDETFECLARESLIELSNDNPLLRLGTPLSTSESRS